MTNIISFNALINQIAFFFLSALNKAFSFNPYWAKHTLFHKCAECMCLPISIKQSTVIHNLFTTAINHVYTDSALVQGYCRFALRVDCFFLFFIFRVEKVKLIQLYCSVDSLFCIYFLMSWNDAFLQIYLFIFVSQISFCLLSVESNVIREKWRNNRFFYFF